MTPNWLLFKKQIESIDQFPENTFGFIYKITHIDTNKVYVGKKSLYHNKKHKLTKNNNFLIKYCFIFFLSVFDKY